MHRVRDVVTAGDSGDWTDPAVDLTGPAFKIQNRSSGIRFCVVAVDASDVQLADAGTTYTYQIFRQWTLGEGDDAETRRAFTGSFTGTIGKLVDDVPPNRGEQGTPADLYVRISGFSSSAGVDHFELFAEGL